MFVIVIAHLCRVVVTCRKYVLHTGIYEWAAVMHRQHHTDRRGRAFFAAFGRKASGCLTVRCTAAIALCLFYKPRTYDTRSKIELSPSPRQQCSSQHRNSISQRTPLESRPGADSSAASCCIVDRGHTFA